MKNNFGLKFELETNGGIPTHRCKPQVVVARAIRIDSQEHKTESVDSQNHVRVNEQEITFRMIDDDGLNYIAKQTFAIGDVKPQLGQYVRGVVVLNQWGSYDFLMTHLLKVKT